MGSTENESAGNIRDRELKPFNYVAYGLGDLYGGGSFFIISTFSMYFLVTVVGLNPVLAGLIPGLGMSAGVMIPYQLLPFVADVDELMTGEHRAGTYAGAMTLLRKLIQGAFVLPLLGLLLTAIGYISHSSNEVVHQAPETLAWLRILFVGSPLLLAVGGALVSFLFPITPVNHQILRDEIARLRAGGAKEEVDVHTKEVCELLTGKEYGELYTSDR